MKTTFEGPKVNSKRMAKMAEILALLHETHKGKDWLFREIRQHKIKIPVKHSTHIFEILRMCPDSFLSKIITVLKDPFDPSVQIPVLTKWYHWFYTDIVGSADPSVLTKDQARKVWVLNELVGRTDTFKQRDPKSDVMTITGDGMVIGFNDSHEKPLRLAIELHKLLSKYNQSRNEKDKIKIRIGIDTGPVYFIKDLTGKDNFWGPGIIMTRRVMDLARPMQILASDKIASYIQKLSPENKAVMHYVGEYKIKHNEKLKIFNIYDSTIGNKLPPPQPTPKTEPEPVSRFLFPRIELKLDVTDSKTMMTHHTWIWKMVNVSDEPRALVSYSLGGDAPRSFANLNIIVRDGNNKKLKISNVNLNKPEHKQFVVKLNKPIKPTRQETLKLEYDWEEPERKYLYKLATECKKFKYLCSVPKEVETKPRVLKVDPMGAKTFATTQADVRYLRDRTEISWQASNVHAFDEYQFEW